MEVPGCGTSGQWLFKILRGWQSGDELVALYRHMTVIVDPSVIGVEMKIHRFDATTTGGKVGGVWKTDDQHCTSISLVFLAYRAAVHVGGIVRAWDGASTLQNWPFAWRHVEYCCSVINTACVLSYVIPLYLSLILYLAYMSWYGTGRLKISYIWSFCALSWMGTSMSRRNCSSATSTWVLMYLQKWSVLSDDMGRCIIKGNCDSLCLSEHTLEF